MQTRNEICKPGTKFANRLQTQNGPCLANSVEIQWKFNGFAGEIQWKFNGNSKTEICKSGREPKGLAQKQNGSRGRQNLGRPSPKVVSRLSPSERPGDAPNRCVAFRTPCRNREQTSAGFRGWKSVVRTGIWKFKSCANSLLFNFFLPERLNEKFNGFSGRIQNPLWWPPHLRLSDLRLGAAFCTPSPCKILIKS